jgi:hypothetical protein
MRNARVRSHSGVGLKGVSPNGPGYMARITVNGKKKYLGTFATPELAHAAYAVAANRNHGDFARTA